MSTDVMSPFDLLQGISQTSQGASAFGAASLQVKEQWAGVGFSLAGQRFVADMQAVSEVLTPPSLTRLPGVKPWVLGVANIRGRLVPLIDLQLFFGSDQASALRSRRVVTVDLGDIYVGLIVEKVFGMKYYPVDTFSEEISLDTFYASMKQHIKGVYYADEEEWPMFDLVSLVRDIDFLNVAA